MLDLWAPWSIHPSGSTSVHSIPPMHRHRAALRTVVPPPPPGGACLHQGRCRAGSPGGCIPALPPGEGTRLAVFPVPSTLYVHFCRAAVWPPMPGCAVPESQTLHVFSPHRLAGRARVATPYYLLERWVGGHPFSSSLLGPALSHISTRTHVDVHAGRPLHPSHPNLSICMPPSMQ